MGRTRDEQRQRYLRTCKRGRDKRLSDDGGFYLSDPTLQERKRRKDATVERRLKTDWGIVRRKFLSVIISGQEYFADAMTGTIYNPDGSSASGGRMRLC